MGRSKSRKSRGQRTTVSNTQLNHGTVASNGTALIDQVADVKEAAISIEACVDSFSQVELTLESTSALIFALEENESGSCGQAFKADTTQAEECRAQSEQLSSILNQIETWMDESQETSVPDPLDQKLTNETVINYEKLDVVLPHYRIQQPLEKAISKSFESETSELPADNLMNSFARLQEQFEQSIRQLEWRVESFLGNLESRIDQQLKQIQQWSMVGGSDQFQLPDLKSEAPITASPKTEHKPGKLEPDSSSPETDWERRKRELLVDFGLSKDEIEQIVPKKSDKRNLDSHHNSQESPISDNRQTNTQPVEAAVCFTSFEIEQLKEQLTAKLREAELELSINRAKLLQESTALEQRLADVSRREAALKSKYAEIEGTNKTGLLDRISRHLSRRPN